MSERIPTHQISAVSPAWQHGELVVATVVLSNGDRGGLAATPLLWNQLSAATVHAQQSQLNRLSPSATSPRPVFTKPSGRLL